MESRPELTTAQYIGPRQPRRGDRYGTDAELARVREIANDFNKQNEAFVRDSTRQEISKLTVLWWAVKHSPEIIRIVSFLRKGFPVNNWKTTISSVIGALVLIARIFGLDVPPFVSDALLAVSLFAVGLFAKDAEKK
jgi:hypothetical protein